MTRLGTLLMAACALSFGAPASGEPESPAVVLTDFGGRSLNWVTVNDNVMGGRSQGGFVVRDQVLRFTGSTNTNGGGFSSLRARLSSPLDLSAYDGIRLRVKADGRRYTFRLTTSTSRQERWAPSYWADFDTRDGAWQVVDVPFDRFTPRWRGQTLKGPTLDTSHIDSLGLMIYDKRDGPFAMQVDWIQAYNAPPAFRMTQYKWKRRPLVVFAPDMEDERLKKQLAAIEETRKAFDERDMSLIVLGRTTGRADTTPLNRAQVQALRDAHEIADDMFAIRLIGKDGGVKRSSDVVVSMQEIYRLIDSMPMRRREMSDQE